MPEPEDDRLLILTFDGRIHATGSLTYFGGTEAVLCNRCGDEKSLWECVRIAFTAVCWGCLGDHERGVLSARPEAMLSLIPPGVIAKAQGG